jgi:hypothetical protein
LPAKTGVVNIQNNIFIPSLSPSLYTVKKDNDFPDPSQPGCHLPNSPWAGIIKLFPARESLVSDIPDGKIANLFLQCTEMTFSHSHPLFLIVLTQVIIFVAMFHLPAAL